MMLQARHIWQKKFEKLLVGRRVRLSSAHLVHLILEYTFLQCLSMPKTKWGSPEKLRTFTSCLSLLRLRMYNRELILWMVSVLWHCVESSKEDPGLLILDNQSWLVKCPQLQQIILLTIPPHSSYRVQPLHDTLFVPWRRHIIQKLMRSNPRETLCLIWSLICLTKL